MRTYYGGPALTDFQAQKLISELNSLGENVKKVDTQYAHIVQDNGLNRSDEIKLKKLLDSQKQNKTNAKFILVVLPRPGTISSWSSKATDIAHNSGIPGVKRIERGVIYKIDRKIDKSSVTKFYDRMTETVFSSVDEAEALFSQSKAKTFKEIELSKSALNQVNTELGLALSSQEIDYLLAEYKNLNRNPSDVELMMFGVVNSEHCRHKIFNAKWTVDGKKSDKSLFKMIKNTSEKSPKGIVSAYEDNAAILSGPKVNKLLPNLNSGKYENKQLQANLVIKVETHNHPTAISPAPGAATGIGGEIRDESATGRGGKSKASLTGYAVSNLNIPGYSQPWENESCYPSSISTSLQIMLEAPIGGAGYANEFGRPNILGYFRTFEQKVSGKIFGYHKPIMIAGGIGNIDASGVVKGKILPGDKLVVLGGPAMVIGLGGGAASSVSSGASGSDLDFASVQRGNAEMERRAQEVIDRCWALGDENPIITIHDVGAGGLSNAFPELLKDSSIGGEFELTKISTAEEGMSPLEIWCNEAQERYVLGVSAENIDRLKKLCERERCPMAVVGEATSSQQLILNDSRVNTPPINVPLDLLFGNPPKLTKTANSFDAELSKFTSNIELSDAVNLVLRLPSVASKKFLITIGDRTVGGMIVRDQMVGPWQVPVSDVAVTASSFDSDKGEAMAIGERPQLAIIDSSCSARIAVAEAITNIVAADIDKIGDIKLSANWMANSGDQNQDKNLYEAVKTLGEDFCPKLNIAIPVGKDSLSMKTKWREGNDEHEVTAPVSLVVSAFAPVENIRETLTPDLKKIGSKLVLIDLGFGKNRMGGSALAQVHNQIGDESPDVDPEKLKAFFNSITELKKSKKIVSYHDRSDGGLFTTICEMMFAGRLGAEVDLTNLSGAVHEILFNEEIGAMLEVDENHVNEVTDFLAREIGNCVYELGQVTKKEDFVITKDNVQLYVNSRKDLEKIWAQTSHKIQKLRDNPKLADQEYASIETDANKLFSKSKFEPNNKKYTKKPRVAILREEGVNGQVEMAAAFSDAGFDAYDVHMSDLITGDAKLDSFVGLVACGGFSYGDVLGAGNGWAKTILFNEDLRDQFSEFFARQDTFSLGVCNGCQMLSALKEIIPGTEHWPTFNKNSSAQFEARLVNVKVNSSPSIFFKGMEDWVMPVPVAHGEGRAEFRTGLNAQSVIDDKLVPLQFVDGDENIASTYPSNPNGSPLGITALTSIDGRATILMPHPERAFLTRQLSWHPQDWKKYSPWFTMFQNAREWIDSR